MILSHQLLKNLNVLDILWIPTWRYRELSVLVNLTKTNKPQEKQVKGIQELRFSHLTQAWSWAPKTPWLLVFNLLSRAKLTLTTPILKSSDRKTLTGRQSIVILKNFCINKVQTTKPSKQTEKLATNWWNFKRLSGNKIGLKNYKCADLDLKECSR